MNTMHIGWLRWLPSLCRQPHLVQGMPSGRRRGLSAPQAIGHMACTSRGNKDLHAARAGARDLASSQDHRNQDTTRCIPRGSPCLYYVHYFARFLQPTARVIWCIDIRIATHARPRLLLAPIVYTCSFMWSRHGAQPISQHNPRP